MQIERQAAPPNFHQRTQPQPWSVCWLCMQKPLGHVVVQETVLEGDLLFWQWFHHCPLACGKLPHWASQLRALPKVWFQKKIANMWQIQSKVHFTELYSGRASWLPSPDCPGFAHSCSQPNSFATVLMLLRSSWALAGKKSHCIGGPNLFLTSTTNVIHFFLSSTWQKEWPMKKPFNQPLPTCHTPLVQGDTSNLLTRLFHHAEPLVLTVLFLGVLALLQHSLP